MKTILTKVKSVLVETLPICIVVLTKAIRKKCYVQSYAGQKAVYTMYYIAACKASGSCLL